MKTLMFHIGIRLYLWLWLPVISAAMNGWWESGYSEWVVELAKKAVRFDDHTEAGYNDSFEYIPVKFDWQSSPLVFMLRNGGDCEDWSAWWRAIYPGGRIYRLYNPELKRGHAVYLVGTMVYDQKLSREIPEADNDKQALLRLYDGRYTIAI